MKKLIILIASLALVASGLSIVPAAADEAPTKVPDVVNVEDPSGDANALNDQGAGQGIGDNPTPVGVGAADVLKAWFANDAETISLHINTTLPPPDSAFGLFYRTFVADIEGCTNFDIAVPSVTYAGDAFAELVCGDDAVAGEVKVETLEDETGIVTATFKRADSPVFATGATLAAPQVYVRGHEGTAETGGLITPVFDSTAEGTDYTVTAGTPTAKKTPPGKNDPPGKKKGCKKGKGKKRGCEGKGKKSPKPGKPSAKCAPFAPGEAGAEKPNVVLTDAATEAKPVEQTVTLEPSAADANPVTDLEAVNPASHDAFNIQLDAGAADRGLYAFIEFEERNDIDLNLLHRDGSYAAQSRGFNTLVEVVNVEVPGFGPLFTSGHGGETTASSEKLLGIRTAPCGGWTLDVANYLGMGGEMSVKLWLGEVQTDPLEEGAETD